MADRQRPPGTRGVRPPPVIFLALLAILSMLGTDIYLPALGEIQADLSSSMFLVGLSLTVYAAGTCVTQLLYGPVSDAIGRKPVLLFGLAVFVAATLGCMFAHDIAAFLAFRFLQAFGVCAATVLWQPIVTDVHGGDDARVRGIFGFVMSFVGISPALAPIAGGALAGAWGWRVTFAVLLALGMLMLLWSALLYRETHPQARRAARPAGVRAVFGSYRTLFGDLGFHLHAWSVAAAVGGYMAYLTVAPFALARFGLSPFWIGVSFLPLAGLFGLGGGLAKWLAARYGDDGALKVGATLAVLAGALFWLSVERGFAVTPVRYVAPFGLMTLAIGITIPTGSAGAIARFTRISGACSSAMNFLTSIAVLVATLLASVGYQTAGNRPLGAILLVAALVSLVCAALLRPTGARPSLTAR